VLTGFREAVMDAIPISLKRAIGVGIGLFILFIGLYEGGLVKQGPPGVPVTLGDLNTLSVLVTLIGLFLTIALMALKVRGALLIGILLTTIVAILINAASGHTAFTTAGVAVIPSRILAWPDFSTFGKGLDFSVFWRAGAVTAIVSVLSIMLADFFDTMGTVIGIAGEAGWLDRDGRLPGMKRILVVDSLSAAIGGLASASSATTYVESAAGVSEGGRSGLTSVVTGLLFFVALFFSPIAEVVPPQATSAALIVVGFLMCSIVKDIPFGDFDEGFPALMTLVVMPFTYSITNGFGAGFITYAFIKLIRGKARELHGLLVGTAAAFAIYFALPWLRTALGF
jgi:AGZA family xanthine/uracil permease-like MFS transporter